MHLLKLAQDRVWHKGSIEFIATVMMMMVVGVVVMVTKVLMKVKK